MKLVICASAMHESTGSSQDNILNDNPHFTRHMFTPALGKTQLPPGPILELPGPDGSQVSGRQTDNWRMITLLELCRYKAHM
jgi:hypothetical protein